MTLLHKCYATIDYRKSVIRFEYQNKLELRWKERGSNPTTQVVSYLKANNMLSKGLGVNENLYYNEFSIEI